MKVALNTTNQTVRSSTHLHVKLSTHAWLITGFVTILTRRVPLVEQQLLSLPDHLSSPTVFSEVRVTRSLVYKCVRFVDCCLSCCPFSFGYCVVCTSSIYGFWLPPFGILKPLFVLLQQSYYKKSLKIYILFRLLFLRNS